MRFHALTWIICSAAAIADGAVAAPADRPNILLIVSDDAGYADFGFQGCRDIPTPHLDGLAKGGLRFTQGYVAGSVCSPSRAGLLSGKTPARIGHECNLREGFGIDTATELLPARLRELGYRTGAIGKWHLGSLPEYLPWKRGFDDFYGFLGGQNNYLTPTNKPKAQVAMLRNGDREEESEYLTTAFAREAARFIARNTNQPWFLYLAFNAVHSPMQADPAKLAMFEHIKDPQRRVLAAMTASMDDGIGRALDALEVSGQASNTLVVFINDNGGATYSRFYNVPLRGHKGTHFEGGIRVPFVMCWPGVLPAGGEYTQPVIALDFLPTFLAMAGAKPEAWADSDGVDLLPFLTGKKEGRPHQTLFWRLGPTAAVRDGDWKLIRIRDHAPLLFNLAEDIAEAHDLAAAKPELAGALLAKITAWEKSLPAPRWMQEEYWDKVSLKDHSGPPAYQGPASAAIRNQE